MDMQRRIKELMAERGWTDYRLAKEANLSHSTVTNMSNRNNAPILPTWEAVCRTFGITLAKFSWKTKNHRHYFQDGVPWQTSRNAACLIWWKQCKMHVSSVPGITCIFRIYNHLVNSTPYFTILSPQPTQYRICPLNYPSFFTVDQFPHPC